MRQVALVMLFALTANSETTSQKQEDSRSVLAEIEASGGTNTSVTCHKGRCVIEWTPKPGRTVVFTDHSSRRNISLAELADLESKLDDGTITDAEFKRLVKIVLRLLRVSKDGA